jgi:two-component system sensor kinase FixL
MSWITVIWAMIASACLTLAMVHSVIWIQQKGQRAHLLFSATAVSVAAITGCELLLMRADTTEQFGAVLKWAHVPVFFAVVSIVGFVSLYLRSGRPWLGYTVCGLRLLDVIIDFLSVPNLNYREITSLRHLKMFGGETISVAEGVRNPWLTLDELSVLLLFVFVADASLTLWRRGDRSERRRALIVGGSMTFFILAAAGQAHLVNEGLIQSPYLISFAFLAVLGAMAYELSRDVLRAQRLSDDLRESQQRMALATHAAKLGLWAWEPASGEVWMTDRGRGLFGFGSKTRLDYPTLLSRVHPEDRAMRAAALKRAIETQGEYEMEYRVLLPDGTLRWIGAWGRCTNVGDGEGNRLFGVSVDITERKQAETEARKHREEVAHLSRLAMMGEMAGSLVHELNQPLAAIVANAGAALRFLEHDSLSKDKFREVLEDIAADGRRAGDVIRTVREMGRKQATARQLLNLNDVIAQVIRLTRSDAHAHNCTIVTELHSALPKVEANSGQLQEVLLNLIQNAFEASEDVPSAMRRLIIRTERDGDSAVRVCVRDFGTGLPVDLPERVFDRFFSTKPEGMGIGLFIARSIVAAHGGTLRAENAEGGGAQFWMRLPAAKEIDV